MSKKKFAAIMTAMLVCGGMVTMTTPLSAYASNAVQTECQPSAQSESNREKAERILADLYANVEDPVIREMGTDLSLAAIFPVDNSKGTVDVVNRGITNIAGKYDIQPCCFKKSTFDLLGSANGHFISRDGKLAVVSFDSPSLENLSKLEMFYADAKRLREATAGMSGPDKVSCLHDAIVSRVTPEVIPELSLVDAWFSGKGSCNDYTGLFYILGNYCGLHVEAEIGDSDREYHAWNTVLVNGQKKYLDLTWDAGSGSRTYYLQDTDTWHIHHVAFTGDFDQVGMQIERLKHRI